MTDTNPDPYLPMPAEVVENRPEVPDVVTLALQLCQPQQRAAYAFEFGQFNMLCLPGVGEVPISIMGREGDLILHTIRAVGRVSNQLVALAPGTLLGLRGPYGNHWPLQQAEGRDVIFITAGLGCAPVVAAIRQAIDRAGHYRRIFILQGVKHRHDLLWQHQYDAWRQVPNCQVLLSASEEPCSAPYWSLGMVTVLLASSDFDAQNCLVMMCGPEPMLIAAMKSLLARGVPPADCYLSLERNMQCGIGHCGHCQMGEPFICRKGPIFAYPDIQRWLSIRGI
jgi:NAD(P)H-flavin reductase